MGRMRRGESGGVGRVLNTAAEDEASSVGRDTQSWSENGVLMEGVGMAHSLAWGVWSAARRLTG